MTDAIKKLPPRLVQQLNAIALKASDPETVFMRQLAVRQRGPNGNETEVDELMKCGMDRFEAVAFLKRLADLGCGKFRAGRRGHATRIVWNEYGAIEMAKVFVAVSVGQTPQESPVETSLPLPTLSHGESDAHRLHRHTFLLRPEFTVAIDLPLDLTNEEANRLADFIRSIPF